MLYNSVNFIKKQRFKRLKNLVSENVVIVANNLNPSLFSQLWLVRQGIADEEDFAPNCVFSQFVNQVFTPDFQLFVVPERLQFTLTDRSRGNSELVRNKLGCIMQKIPHTPYRAIGTNFHWLVAPDSPRDFVNFMRDLFVKERVPIYEEFSEKNARFGAYLSKDVFGTRLRLNIKPVKSTPKAETDKIHESLQLAFNFHLDLEDGEKIIDSMIKFLGEWDRMSSYSEELASIVLASDDMLEK